MNAASMELFYIVESICLAAFGLGLGELQNQLHSQPQARKERKVTKAHFKLLVDDIHSTLS